MASRTVTVAGVVTTIVVTDSAGNTVTLAVTQNPTTGTTMTYASSGNVQQDANQMIAQLMLMLSTGLVPSS